MGEGTVTKVQVDSLASQTALFDLTISHGASFEVSINKKIIELEQNQTLLKEQIQKALSGLSQPLESSKTIQHSNHSVEVEKGPFHSVHTTQASDLIENENKTEDLQQPVYQNPLEASRSSLKTLSTSQ